MPEDKTRDETRDEEVIDWVIDLSSPQEEILEEYFVNGEQIIDLLDERNGGDYYHE